MVSALSFLALVACGDSSGPTPPGQTPSFALSLAPTSVSIAAGGSGSVTVSITRSGGFDGAVTVAVEGLPAGVTSAGVTVAAGASSATLQLTAAAGATASTANLTVRGTGTGVEARTATLALTVTAGTGQTPDFSVSLGAPNTSVQAGNSTQLQVTVARTGGFNGSVQLTATGLPAGVTATFNPATIPAGSTASTLTLAASAGAAAATSTVTVSGTGTGVTGARTAVVSLQVTAAPTGGDTSWSFCGLTGIPLWLAVQNGDGAWTRVNGTNGRYQFGISAARGGVAYVIEQPGGLMELEIFYGTKAELALHGEQLCEGAEGAGKTVNGNVTGFTGITDVTVLSLGGVLPTSAPTQGNGAVTFTGVPDRTLDLMGAISTFNLGTFEMTPSRIFARRGINPAAGSTLPTIDFSGPESFAPANHSLTINGAGAGEDVISVTGLRTTNGFLPTMGLSTSSTRWYSLPANQIKSGDLHILMTTATTAEIYSPTRTMVRMIAQPTNLTFSLGPQLGSPTVSLPAGVGQRRGQVVYNVQAEYDRFWVASFNQGSGNGNRSSNVQMTRDYRGSGSGAVTLEIPEFDGVSGWQQTWGLRPGQPVTWSLSAVGWSGQGGITQPPFTDGSEYRTASRLGELQ